MPALYTVSKVPAPKGLTVDLTGAQVIYITALIRWYEERNVRSTGPAWNQATDTYVAELCREWLLDTGIVKSWIQGLQTPGKEL